VVGWWWGGGVVGCGVRSVWCAGVWAVGGRGGVVAGAAWGVGWWEVGGVVGAWQVVGWWGGGHVVCEASTRRRAPSFCGAQRSRAEATSGARSGRARLGEGARARPTGCEITDAAARSAAGCGTIRGCGAPCGAGLGQGKAERAAGSASGGRSMPGDFDRARSADGEAEAAAQRREAGHGGHQGYVAGCGVECGRFGGGQTIGSSR